MLIISTTAPLLVSFLAIVPHQLAEGLAFCGRKHWTGLPGTSNDNSRKQSVAMNGASSMTMRTGKLSNTPVPDKDIDGFTFSTALLTQDKVDPASKQKVINGRTKLKKWWGQFTSSGDLCKSTLMSEDGGTSKNSYTFPNSKEVITLKDPLKDSKISSADQSRITLAALRDQTISLKDVFYEIQSTALQNSYTTTTKSFDVDLISKTIEATTNNFPQTAIDGMSHCIHAAGELIKTESATSTETESEESCAITIFFDWDDDFDDVTCSMDLLLYSISETTFKSSTRGCCSTEVTRTDTAYTSNAIRYGVNLDSLELTLSDTVLSPNRLGETPEEKYARGLATNACVDVEAAGSTIKDLPPATTSFSPLFEEHLQLLEELKDPCEKKVFGVKHVNLPNRPSKHHDEAC